MPQATVTHSFSNALWPRRTPSQSYLQLKGLIYLHEKGIWSEAKGRHGIHPQLITPSSTHLLSLHFPLQPQGAAHPHLHGFCCSRSMHVLVSVSWQFLLELLKRNQLWICSSQKPPLPTPGLAQDLSSVSQKYSALTGVQWAYSCWILCVPCWPGLTETDMPLLSLHPQCLMQHIAAEALSHGSGRSEKYILCRVMHAITEI